VRLFLIPALLALAGCAPDASEQFNNCKMEATRVYAPTPGGATEGEMASYTSMCMQANGFEMYTRPNDCSVLAPYSTQLSCYRPNRLFDRLWRDLSAPNSN